MDSVLYFVANPTRAALDAAQQSFEAVAERLRSRGGVKPRVQFESSPVRAVAKLRSGGARALVLDARGEHGAAAESVSLALLRSLYDEHEVAQVIGRERAWLVVDGDERGATLAFQAGRLHLGGVVTADDDASAWEQLWDRIAAVVGSGGGRGRIAVCLAGGGVEGMLYELGVLRALERFLVGFSIADVDILCGISAGSILGGLLSNGLGPTAIRQGLKFGTSQMDAIRRTTLFDPNVGELGRRAARLSWDVVRGRRAPVSALFRLPPAGLFAGARLREWLEQTFTRPGMTNRFDDLPHRFFVGVTDQDTSEHVIFGPTKRAPWLGPGETGATPKPVPDIPMHQAIRASSALAPFYAPERINGRYYIDGGFTRTTNMRVAVQEGATLVLLVDPLVPITTSDRGHVADRGAVYVAMQGLKALINARFDKVVPTLRSMYPHVAFHVFQPGESTRRMMAGSPMKYFFREEIEEIAYRETVREIYAHRFAHLEQDFQRHGVRFEDPDAPGARSSAAPSELTRNVVT